MSVPVIHESNSVLSNPQHFWWERRFAASNGPITAWTIKSGGFPTGMTFNATTGHLKGKASLPGVSNVSLTATNADGESDEVPIVIGIEPGAPHADGAIELNWDVATGRITRRTFSTTTGATPEDAKAPLFAVKEDDDLMVRLHRVKAGTPVSEEPMNVRMVLKQREPEEPVLISTGFLTDASATEKTHLVHAKITSTAIVEALAENEDDEGTFFTAQAEFEIRLPNPWWNVPATLVTNLTGDHNDLGFEAVPLGSDGNDVSIAYVDPAANSAALSVVVSGTDITVNLATNGSGAITTTAQQIAVAILASSAASALVTVFLPEGAELLTGVVTAMAAQSLTGGRPGIGGESEVRSSRTFRILVERDLANG